MIFLAFVLLPNDLIKTTIEMSTADISLQNIKFFFQDQTLTWSLRKLASRHFLTTRRTFGKKLFNQN